MAAGKKSAREAQEAAMGEEKEALMRCGASGGAWTRRREGTR